MLHLQQLALRNDLQIIVTSHSPVVLDSVPLNGKIFLDRDDSSGEVVVRPAYRDLIQNALYGRSNETLKLLCEDEIAEGILEGTLTSCYHKNNQVGIGTIGRDTGASEFPMHALSLAKFGQIQVFILDGDQRWRSRTDTRSSGTWCKYLNTVTPRQWNTGELGVGETTSAP